jgi:hypothetical protein
MSLCSRQCFNNYVVNDELYGRHGRRFSKVCVIQEFTEFASFLSNTTRMQISDWIITITRPSAIWRNYFPPLPPPVRQGFWKLLVMLPFLLVKVFSRIWNWSLLLGSLNLRSYSLLTEKVCPLHLKQNNCTRYIGHDPPYTWIISLSF